MTVEELITKLTELCTNKEELRGFEVWGRSEDFGCTFSVTSINKGRPKRIVLGD